jgi:antirestriction protein ArdC
MADIYQMVTDKIIGLLDKGVCPWKQPWKGSEPTNLASGKVYKGINYLLLSCLGFESNYWITYRQAKKLGGSVKAGEKSPCFVVFSDTYLAKKVLADGSVEEEPRWFLKYSPIFNISQCRGIEDPGIEDEGTRKIEPIQTCVKFVEGIREHPKISLGEAAAYHPKNDMITLPAINRFKDAESYYSVLFHELTHWSGAAHRLNRPQPMHSTDRPGYAREELIAEVGSAFICARCGIDTATVEDSASYIHGWLKALRNDRKLVPEAARAARLAVEFLAGGVQ